MHPIKGRLGRTLVVAAMLGAVMFTQGSAAAFAGTTKTGIQCLKVPPLVLSLTPKTGPAGSPVIVSASWPLGCAGNAVIKFRDAVGHVTLMERFQIPVNGGGFSKLETIPVNAAPGTGTVKAAVHYLACDQNGCEDAIAKGSERFIVK